MDFNKNELHIIKFISFYKIIAIFCMILGCLGMPYGIYFSFSQRQSYAEAYLDNALIAASFTVLTMGYLMYCFARIIEKMKSI